jgi:predicted lipoprotein with Yx(FWY)xxD motif
VYLRGGQVAPTAGQGVDSELLGSVRRPDGTRQATLNGWPLYRFSEDRAPGETKGEGLKGTWHVIGPDGKKVVR